MKVATLVSEYPAPSHTFIRREVAALRRLGIDVETFSIRPGRSLSDEDRAEEARTFVVLRRPAAALALPVLGCLVRRPRPWLRALATAFRHSLPGPLGRLRAAVYFAEGMCLAAEMERRGITHVHSHFANPASVAGLAASRYLGIGWSVTVHGASDFEGPMAPLLAARLEDSTFVASATEWARGQLRRVGDPRFHGKIHVVRCGVEVARLPSPVRRPPGAGEPLQILTVGRLSPEKAQRGLVVAVADLVRRGVECRLVLVGGGPEEAALRAEVAAHGLERVVEMRGAVPEAAALDAMTRAHVFALSSRMEGLPVVLMEALALGLPVVAPAITGIPELVVDGETGLLYPAGDWRALADRLATLGANPELRARLASAGRARVLAEFDADRAAAPLARLLESTEGADGRGPPPARR